MASEILKPQYSKAVLNWLLINCILIVLMVVVGGITRLTGSGLSIVDWKPIMGAIPPLNLEQWNEAFHKYQQYPQFKILNSSMSLSQFKFIFFWEYIHRLLGRVIGAAYFFPWVYFVIKKVFSKKLGFRLFFGFILGGMQGVLGWFMVKSGLVDMPSVSHFRLAAHLSLALIVLSYLFYNFLLVKKSNAVATDSSAFQNAQVRAPLLGVTVLLACQIVYGAFVAGLHAGIGYNTFPKMNDEWVPSSLFANGVQSIFENPASVQFVHRTLGMLLLVAIGFLFFSSKRYSLSRSMQKALHSLFGMVFVQFLLGVTTLLLVVPVSVAAIHQLGACVLLLIAVWANFEARTLGAR